MGQNTNQKRYRNLARTIAPVLLASPLVTALAQEENPLAQYTGEQRAPEIVEPHMPENLRGDIRKLVVIAGQAPAKQSVTGSYDQETAGLIGGMDEGSRIGTISKEIGGVPVAILIPVIGTLGAIYGGITGAAKEEIQKFRDALTEDLINADSPPLRSDGLALDAFWSIRRVPGIDSHLFAPSTPIDSDTDAVLYVSLNELTIDVQGKEAVLTASAGATVRRLSDGRDVYETTILYQDRDTLSNWTANDNALWRSYTNYARHYLGREIAADVFDRVLLNHELRPVETPTVEFARRSKTRLETETLMPTLAWDLALSGGDAYGPWAGNIDTASVTYDIEIFDDRQLYYYEKQVPGSQHTLVYELEPCKTYRWSVRPVYPVNGDVRFGEWMRLGEPSETEAGTVDPKGLIGRKASEAPAYTQDFAVLQTPCR